MACNLKAHCDFDFHYFHCDLPKDTVDMEMTIWMVDGIHTYRRGQTTKVTSYSSWSRQVKPFSSLRRKITKYKEEKKESHEKRNFNLFTLARENMFGKKRSKKSQKSRKCRNLDTLCTLNCDIYMANNDNHHHLSVLFGPSSTSNISSVPKLSVYRLPYKTWAICHPTTVSISSLVHPEWS